MADKLEDLLNQYWNLAHEEGRTGVQNGSEAGEILAAIRAEFAQLAAARQSTCSFPERNAALPTEQQGLFRKFIVQRVDGSDQPGGKHHGCEYFVLDISHDAHAPAALAAYAKDCATTHPQLSSDLLARFAATDHAAEPKLDKPAMVGNGRFCVGVKWSTVIGAAQRLFENSVTPEKEAERIARSDELSKYLGGDSLLLAAARREAAEAQACSVATVKAFSDWQKSLHITSHTHSQHAELEQKFLVAISHQAAKDTFSLADAIKQARLKEREACAKVCEEHPDGMSMLGGAFVVCASAIRARSEK